MSGLPERDWDVVVVGAGPAGSASALVCAREGLRVLLLDREALPRPKVCGCCLDPAAIEALGRLGVASRLDRKWLPLRRARLYAWGSRADLSIRGAVLSRERLDVAIAQEARSGGVEVRWPWRARLGALEGGRRIVHLRGERGERRAVAARLVVVACGLSGLGREGASADGEAERGRRRIGLGAMLAPEGLELEPGLVRLAAGPAGYVGVVRLEDGRIDVAASVDRDALRGGTPGGVVAGLLERAGAPALPADLDWNGTPTLRRTGSGRLERTVSVGDTAGFWEPFTGEGIGWALEAGERLAPLARHLKAGGHPTLGRAPKPASSNWILARQMRSRLVAFLAAGPARSRWALKIVDSAPRLGRLGSRRIVAAGGDVG